MKRKSTTKQWLPWQPGGQKIPFLAGTDCMAEFRRQLADMGADRLLLVADRQVWQAHGRHLRAALPKGIPQHLLELDLTESAKSLAMIEQLAGRALAWGGSRRSVVVSFGGGLTCNLAGMLAGLLFRGIRLVHVPTTLLAMHDTVSSLKQAVNITGRKNLLGLYHAPSLICCDMHFLATLSENAIQGALLEIIKNGLVLGEPYFTQSRKLCLEPRKTEAEFALAVVQSGVAAKISLMRQDPREQGDAIVFEYGHTVGHALESCAGLAHGQAIYWGMALAARISLQERWLSPLAYQQHQQLLSLAGEVAMPRRRVLLANLLASLDLDNKRGHLPCRKGYIQMVMLQAIGTPKKTHGKPLAYVPLSQIRQALKTLPFIAT